MKKDEKIQTALNANLEGLYVSERRHQELMDNITGGNKKVKKKIPVSLAIFLAMMMLAAVAVAATLSWEDYAKQAQKMEDATGPFEDWTLESKIDIIRQLTEQNAFSGDDRVSKLLNKEVTGSEAEALADGIIKDFVGGRDLDDIGVIEITEALFGATFDEWPYDKKAWWQSVMDERGPQGMDSGRYTVPNEDELSYEQAVEIVKAYVLEEYDLIEADLEDFDAFSEFYYMPTNPEERVWRILFYKVLNEEPRETQAYSAIIDSKTGEVKPNFPRY